MRFLDPHLRTDKAGLGGLLDFKAGIEHLKVEEYGAPFVFVFDDQNAVFSFRS